MEEKKNKEIKLDPSKAKPTERKELSVDELKEIANNLFNENRFLKNKLEEANNTLSMINRLDYLFKVVEIANSSKEWKFSDEFISLCIAEIEKAMTPPAEEKPDETTTQGN